MSNDDQLLRRVCAQEDPLTGRDLQANHLRFIVLARWRPGFDPFLERVVFERARLKPFSPAVGDALSGFEQNEAFGGLGAIDSPSLRRLNRRLVIGFRLISEERELETILAVERAVAIARAASHPHEDRRNVIDEADAALLV